MADAARVTSVGAFIDALKSTLTSRSGLTWYRGHSDANWPLLPGLLRTQSTISETTLLNRFRQSAAMLTDRKPANSFDWNFLMQHYGVPTRLLDWSESPLAAMYFAVENWNSTSHVDAAIWCLWPTILNQNANIVDKSEGNFIPSFDDEELEGYSIESVRTSSRLELLPVATIATRNNARIQAQMGTFTIHHNKRIAIEDVGEKEHVHKFVIPGSHKESILKELLLLGINRFSLFPEMSSIGEILREEML